jgi:hypothetical protein
MSYNHGSRESKKGKDAKKTQVRLTSFITNEARLKEALTVHTKTLLQFSSMFPVISLALISSGG